MLGFFRGKSDSREEQDHRIAEEVYRKAKFERRLENARAAGIRDADKIANQKPFYQKIAGAGKTILANVATEPKGKRRANPLFDMGNADFLFSLDEPKRRRRKRQ